jgi:hypothetical protein
MCEWEGISEVKFLRDDGQFVQRPWHLKKCQGLRETLHRCYLVALTASRKHTFDNSFLVTLHPVILVKQAHNQDIQLFQLNSSLLQDRFSQVVQAVLVAYYNN